MENQVKDNAGAPSVESLVKRGCLFLEDSDWKKADEYFDKALDVNPEHAPAYIGKLCAELMVHGEESLGNYQELRQGKKFGRPLGEYGNFQKALRFADDGYRKKLNGFEQKIKESFPKIPQRLTDEFVNSEIARLKKEIATCDEKIAKGEEDAKNQLDLINYWRSERKKLDAHYNSYGYSGDELVKRRDEDTEYQLISKTQAEAHQRLNAAQNQIEEYKGKKAEYEAKKQELAPLAGISCLDRMDYHYNSFIQAMQKASTEDEYKNIAEQLRSLEGYKDSNQLAAQCGKLIIKVQYENLIQEKNRAKSEEKYRELSKRFRKFGGYENSAQLADECDKLADECVKAKEREKKAHYDDLVKQKSSASSEDRYRQIAKEFRNLGKYENAVQFADECDKEISIFVKRRAEQERREQQEKARIAAHEAEERRKQAAKEKAIERTKSALLIIAKFIVPVVIVLLALFSGNEDTFGIAVICWFVPFLLLLLIPRGLDGFLRIFSFLRLLSFVWICLISLVFSTTGVDTVYSGPAIVRICILLFLANSIWVYIKPLFDAEY